MKSYLIKSILFSVLALMLFTACQESKQKKPSTRTIADYNYFKLDTVLNKTQVIEIWKTNSDSIDHQISELKKIPDDTLLKQRLVIRSRDNEKLVQITQWETNEDAIKYVDQLIPDNKYKIRVSKTVSYGPTNTRPFVIDTTSSVQYSEFLMFRETAIDTLSNTVKSMTTAMAQAQPTLDFITTMNSNDNLTISLLGVWNTQEGFEIFETQNTWGEKPYWEPYASNDHHMFDVVIAFSKREMKTFN